LACLQYSSLPSVSGLSTCRVVPVNEQAAELVVDDDPRKYSGSRRSKVGSVVVYSLVKCLECCRSRNVTGTTLREYLKMG
jgi:hypothetical protein